MYRAKLIFVLKKNIFRKKKMEGRGRGTSTYLFGKVKKQERKAEK